MPESNKEVISRIIGEKDLWCLYSLQQLPPRKFVVVVGKILSGQYKLLPGRRLLDDSRREAQSPE